MLLSMKGCSGRTEDSLKKNYTESLSFKTSAIHRADARSEILKRAVVVKVHSSGV